MPRLGGLTLVGGGVATNPIYEIHPATEENTMFAAIRYRLARARLAELYCEAVRDAAMDPAIHYDLARARIADVYHQAQRHAGHRPTR